MSQKEQQFAGTNLSELVNSIVDVKLSAHNALVESVTEKIHNDLNTFNQKVTEKFEQVNNTITAVQTEIYQKLENEYLPLQGGVMQGAIYENCVQANNGILDLSIANTFLVSPTGKITIRFTNPPAVNVVTTYSVIIYNGVNRVSFQSGISWADGEVPELSLKKDVLTFIYIGGRNLIIGMLSTGEIN